jgi:NDP-sugar pyrophosphorylase family protein
MKAMIFAAGLGTRLKPFTLQHPKALVPVQGVPMLQRVLKSVADAGIRDVVVNVHHFASQIVDFFASNQIPELNIAISDESGLLLDTGGGLLQARDLLMQKNPGEPILLHNADILTDVSISDMLKVHEENKADVTLLCSHRTSSRTLYFDRPTDRLLGWENLKTGEIKPSGFSPTAMADASPFDGVHIVNPLVFPLLQEYNGKEAIEPFSIVPFYLTYLNRLKIKRYMLPESCQWFDVGSSEKLALAEQTYGASL